MVEKSESGPNILATAIAGASPVAKWQAKKAGQPEPEPLENPLHKLARQIAEGAARAGKPQLPPPAGETADSSD
jgi:hypothetical protein